MQQLSSLYNIEMVLIGTHPEGGKGQTLILFRVWPLMFLSFLSQAFEVWRSIGMQFKCACCCIHKEACTGGRCFQRSWLLFIFTVQRTLDVLSSKILFTSKYIIILKFRHRKVVSVACLVIYGQASISMNTCRKSQFLEIMQIANLRAAGWTCSYG